MCHIPLGEPKTPNIISQVHKTGSLEAQRCRAWFPKYALLYPLPSATSARRFAIGSSKPTSMTSSSLGPLRPLRGSRYALRQPDDFVAGEYQTTSAKTTPNSSRYFPLTPAFAGGCRYPIGRDARQAVGVPNALPPHPIRNRRDFKRKYGLSNKKSDKKVHRKIELISSISKI